MKKIQCYLFVLLLIMQYGCQSKLPYGAAVGQPEQLIADPLKWTAYKKHFLKLHEDFIALDTLGNEMVKSAFFKTMADDKFFPLRLQAEKGNYYKLQRIDFVTQPATVDIIGDWARRAYRFYQMEGKRLPAFSFRDIDGKLYDAAALKGKIVVLKCWFIACAPCIEEIPALNSLVQKHRKESNIAFISLALDSATALKNFLRTTRFDYEIIPDKKDYIYNQLAVDTFPTHFIVNEKGLIEKVVTDESALAEVIEKMLERKTGLRIN